MDVSIVIFCTNPFSHGRTHNFGFRLLKAAGQLVNVTSVNDEGIAYSIIGYSLVSTKHGLSFLLTARHHSAGMGKWNVAGL